MTEQEVRAVVEQLLSRLNAGELAMPAAQVPTPARIPAQTPEQDGVIEDIEQVDLRRQYLVENAHDAAIGVKRYVQRKAGKSLFDYRLQAHRAPPFCASASLSANSSTETFAS